MHHNIPHIIYRISYITYHIYFDGFSTNLQTAKNPCVVWTAEVSPSKERPFSSCLTIHDVHPTRPSWCRNGNGGQRTIHWVLVSSDLLGPYKLDAATDPMRSSNESTLNPPGPFFDFMWSGYNHWFMILFGISESWIWTPQWKLVWFLSQIINHGNPQLFP